MRDARVEILHLIDTYRIGGPGKTIINSARFIAPGYRVHVASFVSADDARNEFREAVLADGIPYLGLPEVRRFDLDHLRLLRDYVRRERIAILHAHGYRSDAIGYLLSFMVPRLRVVTTHHGWIRNSARQRMMVWLAVRLGARLHGVSCVSEKLLEELPRSLRRRAAVVHNGIVLQDYVPGARREEIRRQLGLQQDDLLLAVIGRLSAEKGVVEMLEAFERLGGDVPRAHLAYVGEGPLRPQLEARIAAGAGRGRVHLLGHWQPVQPIFDAADVIVSPSLTEGLSNVLLEAMAMRRPIVATRAGGNAEIVEDGTTALMVPVGDVTALAGAIHRIAADAGLRQGLVERAADRVRREFSFEARMRKEEAFYDRVLAGSARAGALQEGEPAGGV
jgi:glycosyltransferase involved in cell wall biosynthesis